MLENIYDIIKKNSCINFYSILNAWISSVIKLLCMIAFATFAVAQRNPPPCESNVGRFSNDYGGCENYFYCQSTTVAIPLMCPETYGFDPATESCTVAHVDPPECELCPAADNGVAVANDNTTCSEYVLCVDGARDANVVICDGGTLFDRAWGQCRPESVVLCPTPPGGPPEVGPDCTVAEDIPHDTDCRAFWV